MSALPNPMNAFLEFSKKMDERFVNLIEKIPPYAATALTINH